MKPFRYKPMSKWTPTLALRRSKCRIADAKAALLDLAAVWSDVDDFVCTRVDEIGAALDGLLDDVREAFEDQIARDEEA